MENTRLLVVDDDKELLELYWEVLEEAGFACFTASSGQDALAVFAAEEIDLAVVDALMPNMSGLDLFAKVKENHPKVAVVLVSDEDRMDIAVSQIKEGALDYLVKPVDKSKLIEAVNRALEKQSAYLESCVHQQHLEELLVLQSKALENKIREVEALNQRFACQPEGSEKRQAPESS